MGEMNRFEYNNEMSKMDAEKKIEKTVEQKLDRINILKTRNQKLTEEIEISKTKLEFKIRDQEESGALLDEQLQVNEILQNPTNNKIQNEISTKEVEIKRNLDEIAVIIENLKKLTS